MKNFVLLVISFLLIFHAATQVSADESSEKLNQFKAQNFANIDFRIKTLQLKRDCVSKAISKEEIKECTKRRKDALTSFKSDKKQKKNEKISQRLEKLEEQEEKLRQKLKTD